MADFTSKSSLESDLNVTHLCFEGGNVIIYLSLEDEDILILPSEVLVKASKWFEAAINRWQKGQTLDGGCTPVHQLYLTHDRDLQSWTLSSKAETAMSPEVTSKNFPRLYTTRFPVHGSGGVLTTASVARKSSIIAHKCLFALVYQVYSGYANIEAYAPLAGDVVVLAEFYQLKTIELQNRLNELEWTIRNIDLDLPAPFFTNIPNRPRTRAKEAIFLARSIFLDWLATQMPRSADKSTPDVFAFYLELHRQGVHRNITIFGHGLCRKANETYRCLSWEAERHFTRALHQYLEEASRLIGEVMHSTEAPPARFEGTGRPYFTHMTITDEELPWAEDGEAREDSSGEEDSDNELPAAADETLHRDQPRENKEMQRWLETREHPDTIDEHIKREEELKRNRSDEWKIQDNDLALPASEEWLRLVGLSRLINLHRKR